MPDQFYITLDRANRTYLPGDVVSGTVVASYEENVKTKGLLLSYNGNAHCHWSERRSHHTVGARAKGKGHTDYYYVYYSGDEDYFKNQMFLVGNGAKDIYLPAGSNSYPFSFALPATSLPCNWSDDTGGVKYEIEAKIIRSWAFDYKKIRYTANSSHSERYGHSSGGVTHVENSVSQIQRTGDDIGPGMSLRLNNIMVQVPSGIPPTRLGGQCTVIDLTYFVKVELDMLGAFTKNVELELPITVGTIPLDTSSIVPQSYTPHYPSPYIQN